MRGGSGGEQKEYIAIIPVLLKGVVESPWDILVNTRCKELVQALGLIFYLVKDLQLFI